VDSVKCSKCKKSVPVKSFHVTIEQVEDNQIVESHALWHMTLCKECRRSLKKYLEQSIRGWWKETPDCTTLLGLELGVLKTVDFKK